jgi:hypothetical protein
MMVVALLGVLGAAAGLAFASSEPPTPTITQHPTDPTSSTDVTFAFTDAQANVHFECRLDSGAWTTCTSPTGYNEIGRAHV